MYMYVCVHNAFRLGEKYLNNVALARGARGSVVGRGIMLQTARSRVRDQMRIFLN
jgi:hypothetical protein